MLRLFVTTFLVVVYTCSPASAQSGFRAGAFAMDITPEKFPVSVNGGMQDGRATEATDRLHARCLVLDDGKLRIAFVVCDSCMIPREVTDPAKKLAQKLTGIPPERILISATHCHSAPTVAGVFQSEPDEDYRQYLIGKIAAGVEKAVGNLAPAQIGWAVGSEPKQLFNRRWKMKEGVELVDPFGRIDHVKMNPGYKKSNPNLLKPAGPIDPDVSIVSVRTPQGKPIGLLANYSLHYVGGVKPLSADYFGMFAERIGNLIGADKSFVGILSNGTSGDINNVDFANGPGPARKAGEQARIVAESVAQAAFTAYKTIEHRPHVDLAMKQREIELGVRRPDAKDLARAEKILAESKKLTTLPQVYARETVLMAKYPPKVKAILQAIRVGELGIVSTPCETFVEIGLELKRKSPLKPTFTIELANGYNGYLPTPEQHALGGYETWRARSSYLETNASRVITDNLLEMLGEVAK